MSYIKLNYDTQNHMQKFDGCNKCTFHHRNTSSLSFV